MSTCLLPSSTLEVCMHGVKIGGNCHYCRTVSNEQTKNNHDPVNHPSHYTNSPASCERCAEPIECITITRHMCFNLGNAIKYLWRAGSKTGEKMIIDLKKARWYLDDKIKQLENKNDDQKNKRL